MDSLNVVLLKNHLVSVLNFTQLFLPSLDWRLFVFYFLTFYCVILLQT